MAEGAKPQLEERVLVLAPTRRDAEVTRDLLTREGLAAVVCGTLTELASAAREGAGALLLTDDVAESPQLPVLLEVLRDQPAWSELPLVLLAKSGAVSEAVVRLMNAVASVTLLERPVNIRTLLSAVNAAVRARRRQYQVRQQMEELQQAEAALRESEERFREMADHLPQLAWSAGPDGAISWYNRRWYEYTGTTPEQMAGWGWQSVHDPATLPAVMERWTASLRSGAPFEMEFALRGADGRFRWFLTRATPFRDSAGRVVRWFGTNTDVTDQRRLAESERSARAEAERANRTKDQFLAVLSHELRTPLAPVVMAVSLMEKDASLPTTARQFLSMIRRNIELETKLIDDLLDLSRVANGKLQLDMRPVRLHALIHQVVEMCQPEATDKRVALRLDLAATDDRINADAARVQQALWNVLKNGVKFTPAGRAVHVRTHSDGNRIAIDVRDEGVGIAPDILPRLFVAFEQGDAAVTRQFGGLGLGLAISKAIIDLQGGAIEATSPGAGMGSTFRITLPLTTDAALEPASVAPHEPRSMNGSVRVLVVEDHEDTARMLARLLQTWGYHVRVAHSVREALKTAADDEFDLVLSDIGLPDATGYDLMRQLRARHGLVGLCMSGFGMDDDHRQSREAGFAEHLVKPISPHQLGAALRRISPRREVLSEP